MAVGGIGKTRELNHSLHQRAIVSYVALVFDFHNLPVEPSCNDSGTWRMDNVLKPYLPLVVVKWFFGHKKCGPRPLRSKARTTQGGPALVAIIVTHALYSD